MSTFKLLNTGYYVPPIARRRLWVAPNEPVHLASGVRFVVEQIPVPGFLFTDENDVARTPLTVHLRTDLGLVFIPRAMELGARDMPVRFLIEIALLKTAGNLPGYSANRR